MILCEVAQSREEFARNGESALPQCVPLVLGDPLIESASNGGRHALSGGISMLPQRGDLLQPPHQRGRDDELRLVAHGVRMRVSQV